MISRKIISMDVQDEPGVLNRISGMFTRRGFNIKTITVGKTEKKGLSRMVATVEADERMLEQLEKQIKKLVDVVKIVELQETKSVMSEYCLVKVAIPNDNAKKEIMDYVNVYKNKIADITPKSMIIEIVGKPEKIDAFLELMRKFGIKDISRTGITAMGRGSIDKNGNDDN